MDRIDDAIGRALGEEDRALLARHAEQGYFTQALGLFRGPMSWVAWLVYAAGLASFLAAAYALWSMAMTADATAAVKWGVAGVVLVQFALLSKSYLGLRMESNRLLREIKRVELQVALRRD